MKSLKVHYQVYATGGDEANLVWGYEDLIPNKAKFCDGLMMKKNRNMDFTKETDFVDCKKCQRKMEAYWKNGFDLPC